MTLLRQWQLLEMLMTTMAGARPLTRLVVWNIHHIDSAIAVALAHLHCLPQHGGILVFHSGALPARRPLDWPQSELRGIPSTEWLEPVDGRRGRKRPNRRLLEAVVLGQPSGPIDLLILDPPDVCGPNDLDAAVVGRVRQGGYLLCTRSDRPTSLRRPGLEPVEGPQQGPWQVFRKATPCTVSEGEPTADETQVVTLGDHHDQALLLDSHLNLARALARRFARRGERIDDLEQVALVALVRAASRFDASMGRPFSAFATPCIVGELKRHFRDKLWMVRVPRSVQEMHLAIRDARDELTQRNGQSPSIAQIAGHLETSEEEVLSAMEAASNSWATSLDRSTGEDQTPATEIPVIDDGFERSLDRDLLMEAISRLDPTEQLVVRRVFFDGRTQRQVATEIGVSQMQISRLMTRTLQKMRRSFQPV